MAHPVNIIVIDDDASVRKALKRLIRSAGMVVQTFPSARDFLAADVPEPDCLVLDVRMPGMSGLELQQQLAVDHRDIPIIFITAHDDQQACRMAMEAGATDFLHKPFEDRALLAALARATPHPTAPISNSPPK